MCVCVKRLRPSHSFDFFRSKQIIVAEFQSSIGKQPINSFVTWEMDHDCLVVDIYIADCSVVVSRGTVVFLVGQEVRGSVRAASSATHLGLTRWCRANWQLPFYIDAIEYPVPNVVLATTFSTIPLASTLKLYGTNSKVVPILIRFHRACRLGVQD